MRLEREVSKWDDSANDIIVLAKQMCMIMMEMTDFTRLDKFSFYYVTIIIVINKQRGIRTP